MARYEFSTSCRPQATSRFQKPPPRPSPKGRECCLMQAMSRRRSVGHELQPTSYWPQATRHFSRFPGRGRLAWPRSGVHAGREAEARLPPISERREGFQTLPYMFGRMLKSGHGAYAGQKLQATGHHPVTITTYQVLRTTYHVPTGRTHGCAPTTRYNALQATSYTTSFLCLLGPGPGFRWGREDARGNVDGAA